MDYFVDIENLLKSADAVYTARLESLNNSTGIGTAYLALTGTELTVAVAVGGLTAGEAHLQHIHGRVNGNGRPIDSTSPVASQDTDLDGIIEVGEGATSYGPVLVPLDFGDGSFPTADANGAYRFVATYDISDDAEFAGSFDAASLLPLGLREVVVHGGVLPAGVGAGTGGEVDGSGGYIPALPVLAGEIELTPTSEAIALLNADRVTFGDESVVSVLPGLFIGTNDDDVLAGAQGDDTLWGNGGEDDLSGGRGDDIVRGGLGDDRVDGDFGDDVLFGGRGNDLLLGDAGNDVMRGNGGDDDLFGSFGNDLMFGNAGADLMIGNRGTDVMNGGQGNDTLAGNSQADAVRGGMGDDLLFGGYGADYLTGGLGDDTMRGGPGDDTFIYGPNFAGDDVIEDFSVVHDTLDFRRLRTSPFDLLVSQEDDGVLVEHPNGSGSILLEGVTLAQYDAIDIII